MIAKNTLLMFMPYLCYFVWFLPRIEKINSKNDLNVLRRRQGVVAGGIVIPIVIMLLIIDPINYRDEAVLVRMLVFSISLILIPYTIFVLEKNLKLQKEKYDHLRDLKHGKKDELKEKEKLLHNLKKKLQIQELDLEAINQSLIKKSKELKEKESSFDHKLQFEISKREERLRESYISKVSDLTEKMTKVVENRIAGEKINMVQSIFDFDNNINSDQFEISQRQSDLKKEQDALNQVKFLNELKAENLNALQYSIRAQQAANEARVDNAELKAELKINKVQFEKEILETNHKIELNYSKIIQALENEQKEREKLSMEITRQLDIMKVKEDLRYANLKHYFEIEMKNLINFTLDQFRIFKDQLSELKLGFGKEILRIDGQQQKIIAELEAYYNKSKELVLQCKSFNLESAHHVKEALFIRKQTKTDMQMMEQRLTLGFEKLSLKEAEAATKLGTIFLNIKNLNAQHDATLRDIGLERKGLEIAYIEKEKDHKRNLQEIRHQRESLNSEQRILSLQNKQHEMRIDKQIQMDRHNYQRSMDQLKFTHALQKAQRSQKYLKNYS